MAFQCKALLTMNTKAVCFVECSPGEYGENCKLKCSDNCKDPACNTIDGSCSDTGCKPGFKGKNCTAGLKF